MTQITRVPQGLQGYLGTQAQGKNPSDLGQIISPVLNMNGFYNIGAEFWEDCAGFFSVNTIIQTIVPEREIWLLKSVGIENDGGGAGGRYIASVFMDIMPQSSAPPSEHPLAGTFEYNQTAAAGPQYVSWELSDVVAFGGSRIRYQFSQVAGVNFAPRGWTRYLKLQN